MNHVLPSIIQGDNWGLKRLGKERHRIILNSWKVIRSYRKRYFQNDPVMEKVFNKLSIYADLYTSNTAALADLEETDIFLNLEIFKLSPHGLEKTTMHEIIHLYNHEKFNDWGPHDEKFTSQMQKLGFKDDLIKHNLQPVFEFIYKCSKCNVKIILSKRIEGGDSCISCGGGKFRFKIKRIS